MPLYLQFDLWVKVSLVGGVFNPDRLRGFGVLNQGLRGLRGCYLSEPGFAGLTDGQDYEFYAIDFH